MKVNLGTKGNSKSKVSVARNLKRKSTFLYKGQRISGDGSSRQIVNQVLRSKIK